MTLCYPDGPRARRLRFATSFKDKLIGLLFRSHMDTDEGLFFKGTNAIHTVGMRMPIDVLFLAGTPDGTLRVVEAHKRVAPMKTLTCKAADHVLELAAGALEQFGDVPSTIRIA